MDSTHQPKPPVRVDVQLFSLHTVTEIAGARERSAMLCCCRAAAPAVVYDASQLLDAANKGKDDLVRTMLSANIDANHIRASDGVSALYLASTEGHSNCVQLLIDANANLNHQLAGLGGRRKVQSSQSIGPRAYRDCQDASRSWRRCQHVEGIR